VWFFGIPVLLIGLAAGFWLRSRGFALPILYEIIVWVVRDANGDLVNSSGNGDNLGAEAALAAMSGVLLGGVAVLVGLALRRLVDVVRARFR
jgi:hypothetical protein